LLGTAATAGLICLWALVAYGDVGSGAAAMMKVGPLSILVGGLSQLFGFGFGTWYAGFRLLALDRFQLRWLPARAGLPGLAGGLAIGSAAAAIALLGAVLLAHSRWSRDAGGLVDYLVSVVKTALVLAPAALSEEVMFRGIPLVLLAAVLGRGTALVLVAGLLFAFFHGLNPGVTSLGLGNIALAGIFLGLTFYAPGGIWTAFGAHLGWNATLAALDAPVSGLPFNIPLLDYRPGSPVWLSGGKFGPEGGLMATIAITLASVVPLRWIRREAA